MSYNILNKNVNFQGSTQGTVEDLVDTHSTQTVNGLKTVTYLTGTHILASNDITVLGNVSASVNVSASAFYGDGSTLSNIDLVVTAFNNSTIAAASKVCTAAGTELDAEAALTFNSTTRELVIGAEGFSGIVSIYGTVSGSGNISGSNFYGAGTGLTSIPGSAVTLATNSGLNDSSGLIIDITSATEENTTDREDDYLLFYDNSVGLRKTKLKNVADLFTAAVTQMNNKLDNRLVTIASTTTQLDGEANLTFDGSVLTVAGNISGSGETSVVSASYGWFQTDLTVRGSLTLYDASSLAGLGLDNLLGTMFVSPSGSVSVGSGKVGISGSIAGTGLTSSGGVNSISSIDLDLNGLAAASISVANDFIVIIDDDDDDLPKKESFADVVTTMKGDGLTATSGILAVGAGTGIDVSTNAIAVDVSDFMAAGVDNRVLTATGADAFTGEANLTFDDNTLTFGNSLNASASVSDSAGTDTAGKHFVVEAGSSTGTGAGGSFIVRTSEAGPSTGTSVNANQLAFEVTQDKAAKIYGPLIGDTPTASSMENDGQISTLRLTAHINSASGTKTGVRFQGTGTAGQMIIVIVGSTGDLVFHATEGTCKVRGINTGADTMKANGAYFFISDGSLWSFIGGGAATNAIGLQA